MVASYPSTTDAIPQILEEVRGSCGEKYLDDLLNIPFRLSSQRRKEADNSRDELLS